MRQRVACGTCALVDWIDNLFPCYLFEECPENLKPQDGKSDDECDRNEDDASEHEGSEEEEEGATHLRRDKVLRDAKGYYVLDAHATRTPKSMKLWSVFQHNAKTSIV